MYLVGAWFAAIIVGLSTAFVMLAHMSWEATSGEDGTRSFLGPDVYVSTGFLLLLVACCCCRGGACDDDDDDDDDDYYGDTDDDQNDAAGGRRGASDHIPGDLR